MDNNPGLITTFLTLIYILWNPFSSCAQSSDDDFYGNIVISEIKNTFVLTAGKDGKSVANIKEYISETYRALKTPGRAKAYVFYDETQTIDKAKAKGVKPVFVKSTPSGVFFDGSYMCVLDIPIKEPGKEVEAVFERTYHRPDFCDGTMLRSIYPVEHLVITYRIPVSLRGIIDVIGHNLPSDVSIDKSLSRDGKEYVITVTGTDLPPLNESRTPPGRRVLPYVQLVGFYADVNDLYRNMHAYVVSPDPDSTSVETFAREITADCLDDSARITAIHRWVNENIRYIAIENGELGQAPDHPSEVLRKRFGDCKGSAALMKAMLRAVGLDGRLVWVGTDDISEEWTEVPLYSTGNHMITAVMLPNDSIVYLDGTVGMADREMIPPAIAGKQTLIENGETCIVHRVPACMPEANVCHTTIHYNIDGKELKGTYSESLTGSYKARLLNALRENDASDRDKIMTMYIRELRRAFEVENVRYDFPQSTPGPAVYSADVSDRGSLTFSGRKIYVSFNQFTGISSMAFELEHRTLPGMLNEPCKIIRTISLTLPAGTEVVGGIPDDFSIETPNFSAELTYALNNNEITSEMTLAVKESIIPLEDLPTHNEAVNALSKALSQRLVLTSNNIIP